MPPEDIKKNELLLLIHNMESHEKAYYKKMTKRYAERYRSLHLQLFELIEKHKIYDEKLFVKKMGIKSAAHFSGIKNRLWKDILSAIVYQKRNDPLARLMFSVLETEMLLSRHFIQSAGKLLDIAWEKATQYEYYSIQTRLIHLRYQLLPYSDFKHYQAESERLLHLQGQVMERLQCEQQLQMRSRELIAIKQFTYLRISDSQLKRIRTIETELNNITIAQGCPLLQILHLFTSGAATHLSYQFDKCHEFTEAFTQLWRSKSYLIAQNALLFLSCADYCFYNAFALKNVALAQHYLQIYETLATEHLNIKEQEQWHIIAFNTQLKIYHKTACYDKVLLLLQEKSEWVIERVNRVLPPVSGISILSSICISWFVLEEYDKAESLLIDVNNLNHLAQREDILYFTSIFYLLILFEHKKMLQLNHAISTSYFRLYNKKKLQPFEKDLMLFLKQLSNEYRNEGKMDIIKNFLKKLEVYKNDPIRDLYFLYFNYYGWMESKVAQIKYTEYMHRKVHHKVVLS